MENQQGRPMTPDDLELYKIRVQLEAIRVVLRMLYTGYANSSPSAAKEARAKFSVLRSEKNALTIQELSPEYSDMMTAEYQEALEDLLNFIESGIRQ